ncbi:cytochrome C [Archangium sp. Cb G35]|uniref:c-type cytochrome n=1 Tax=Archangium sp. Cb G35 TaxID=1920190 RepID=UPI000937E68A|nr:cytochrome c [Archangium sp. Cb G35]OJT21151.1 cytochrome C [Archangium sp. Cb G35]WNG55898.1 cytochrome c [Archangium gephyra]
MDTYVLSRRQGRALAVAALPMLALLAALPAAAQGVPEGAQLFNQRCASCHTVGQGDRVGPDLMGVLTRREESWVTSFLKSPGAMIDGGDPIANELLGKFNGIRMPDQQLTDDERKGLFAFFRDCAEKGSCQPGDTGPKLASDATPEQIEHGRQLFEGRAALANGGPPCIGCHNVRDIGVVGGGTLARDLTFAYARLGERKLTPALKDMDFPLMKDLYGKAPLTDAEQYEVKAYLASVSRDGTPPRKDRDFFYLGFVGMGVALGFIGIVLGGRGRAKD